MSESRILEINSEKAPRVPVTPTVMVPDPDKFKLDGVYSTRILREVCKSSKRQLSSLVEKNIITGIVTMTLDSQHVNKKITTSKSEFKVPLPKPFIFIHNLLAKKSKEELGRSRPLEVCSTLNEYIAARGVKNSRTMRRKCRKEMMDLMRNLFNPRQKYKFGEYIAFNLLEFGGITTSGEIYVTFTATYIDIIKKFGRITHFPMKSLKLPDDEFRLLLKVYSQYEMNKKNPLKLRIKKVLEYLNIKKYEDLKDRKVKEKIVTPLIKKMSLLKKEGFIKDWNFEPNFEFKNPTKVYYHNFEEKYLKVLLDDKNNFLKVHPKTLQSAPQNAAKIDYKNTLESFRTF
jgi:hypothetical protein